MSSDYKDDIIDALKASQLDLRTENARLQERVREAEGLRRANSDVISFLQVERDGWKALAKVRGEALEADKEDFEHDLDCGECARLRDENTDWLAYPSCDEGLRLGHRALDLREPAIAMTPEEAWAKERQGE